MKMRRRGLIVVLTSDGDKDDRRLRHLARRFNKVLLAGYGNKRMIFDLADEYKILHGVLCVVWGKQEGERLSKMLAKVITRIYVNGKEKP